MNSKVAGWLRSFAPFWPSLFVTANKQTHNAMLRSIRFASCVKINGLFGEPKPGQEIEGEKRLNWSDKNLSPFFTLIINRKWNGTELETGGKQQGPGMKMADSDRKGSFSRYPRYDWKQFRPLHVPGYGSFLFVSRQSRVRSRPGDRAQSADRRRHRHTCLTPCVCPAKIPTTYYKVHIKKAKMAATCNFLPGFFARVTLRRTRNCSKGGSS